jgi:NADH-quinone oxidoreductase subunit G
MAVTLKVNNIEVTVPKGSTILDAAEQAGVFIPTLCHDKRIAPSGACRLCIVEECKRPGQFLPSCFTPARAGMEIITESPAILEAVREQLKLILINHPLECPVCDKAGECLLQDLVVRYGIVEVPYQLAQQPRVVDLESPLIERDMARCILCGRCVRICSELQGRNELEFIGRGYRMSVGTDGGRPLDCDFCGLCISACPVGALSDKLFKNTTRVWKLEKRGTVCSHCGLGCGVELNMEGNRIRRVTAPRSPDGKEGLICVRGRFGWRAFEEHGRPATPQINDNGRLRNADWDEALNFMARRISEVRNSRGSEAFAALTADLLTTDEAFGYGRFFRAVLGSESVSSIQASGYRSIITQLDAVLTPEWKMASMNDIMETDILLILGGGAAELHPVLKPVINRYLKTEGRELIVISSWPDYAYERATLPIAVAPGLFGPFMNDLREALAASGMQSRSDTARYVVDTCRLAQFISILQKEENITVFVVPDLYGRHDARALLAASLHDRVRGILPLGGRFNSLGAIADGGFFSATGRECDDILADIETGKIKALYLLGEDPLADCRDPERVRRALQALDLLICQSPYRTSVAELAHVFLPTALPPEKQGPVLSITGERHHIRPVMRKPGGVRSDGEILHELVRIMGLDEKMFLYDDTGKYPADRRSRSFPLPGKTSPSGPLRIDGFPDRPPSADFPFHLFPVHSLYGDGILTRRSPEIESLRNGLVVVMNRGEFGVCGFAEKEAVEIRTPSGSARVRVVSSAKAQKGTLLLRHAAGDRNALSLLGPGNVATFASIRKAKGR